MIELLVALMLVGQPQDLCMSSALCDCSPSGGLHSLFIGCLPSDPCCRIQDLCKCCVQNQPTTSEKDWSFDLMSSYLLITFEGEGFKHTIFETGNPKLREEQYKPFCKEAIFSSRWQPTHDGGGFIDSPLNTYVSAPTYWLKIVSCQEAK